MQDLEGTESNDVILAATTRQVSGRGRMSGLETTRAQPHQQLAADEHDLPAMVSDNKWHDREVAGAEQATANHEVNRRYASSRALASRASWRPTRVQRPRSGFDSPRAPAHTRTNPRRHSVESSSMDETVPGVFAHMHYGFGCETRYRVHAAPAVLPSTHERYPGPTLRKDFRHTDAAPVSKACYRGLHARSHPPVVILPPPPVLRSGPTDALSLPPLPLPRHVD